MEKIKSGKVKVEEKPKMREVSELIFPIHSIAWKIHLPSFT